MVYRIDFQHYLTHAIDHFTREELIHLQYLIVSAAITNQGKSTGCVKANDLYPPTEMIMAYDEYKDEKIFDQMYRKMLDGDDEENPDRSWLNVMLYKYIINPLISHTDILIICDRSENLYIDSLCRHLKKRYSVDVIDLNELFIKGHVGEIYIDRDKIWDKAVDIRREAGRQMIESMESSEGGRLKLLKSMTKKEKIKKLKDLGISVNEADKKDLNALLVDAWVKSED